MVGELQNRSYDAKDGTKRYVTEIVAEDVEFLTPRGERDASGAGDYAPRNDRPAPQARKGRRKVCAFCADKVEHIDYKDVNRLRKFTTERGKIMPRRMSGVCAKHQRELAVAIKRSRQVALMPYVAD